MLAVVCISASAPLIAACAAPSLAIAMWRCLLAGALTIGWIVVRTRAWPQIGDQLRGCLAAAVALAAHFATWIPSLRLTTVALSTAMVSTQPIWGALITRVRGTSVARPVWLGMAISALGVITLTGLSSVAGWRSWLGIGLALVSAVLAAVYVLIGQGVRRHVDAGSYTSVVYVSAAVALLVVCVLWAVPLAGYTARDWGLIVAITLVAQIGGHSVLNLVVKTTSASVVNTAILFEAPGAAILAALWLGQSVAVSVWIGLAIMLAGLVLVVRSTPPTMPDPAV